jgi:hypothetical protein
MVISIALSGIFVVLLTGMLSQTLQFSTNSQNELIAANAAELLIENARSMPYSQLSIFATGLPVTMQVNSPDGTLPPTIRPLPVQLNLADTTTVFGEVNGLNGSIQPTGQWQIGPPSMGNYFRGIATETISSPQVAGGLTYIQVTVQVSYISASGGSGITKQTTRTASIFQPSTVSYQ